MLHAAMSQDGSKAGFRNVFF